MNARYVVWAGLSAMAVFLAIGIGWFFSLPTASVVGTPPPIPENEARLMLAALQPPKRQRPVVAIIAINDATETTDYLLPYGILKRADVADVLALAVRPGPVTLFPALKVEPEATIAQFDARYPEGADYVIVPAMSRDDDPQVLHWLKQQADGGAIIIGVCAGAKVVAAAGLLDGRPATTHWYYLDALRDGHPGIHYVRNRRMVIDQGVATTTGVTASMPMMLTLIEAIAGTEKAGTVAREIGVRHWDARHNSDAFKFTRSFALTAVRNRLAFWSRAEMGIALRTGIDEASLALVADAWSRTYRSSVLTYAGAAQAVETRNGLRVIPDQTAMDWPAGRRIPEIMARKPAEALDQALERIAGRYGNATADFVAMQLEYPERGMRP